MIELLKRHEIQVLRRAGHSQPEVAKLAGVSERSVQRVEDEPAVSHVDTAAERVERKIGRPSKAEPFRSFVVALLAKEPELLSLEILRRARLEGYDGGKTALYELIHSIRPKPVRLMTRFEGLPGEFSQHDFGRGRRAVPGRDEEADPLLRLAAEVLALDRGLAGAERAGRKPWSERWSITSRRSGASRCWRVFDRPKTIASHWGRDGQVTEWNPTFAGVALDLGLGVELCWPHSPEQKGSVENLVKWVKGSFFKQRRFLDEEDLVRQLREWLVEVNTQRPSRATSVIPEERLREERPRLRPLKVAPAELALRIPGHRGADRRWSCTTPTATRCRRSRWGSRARCTSTGTGCASWPAATRPSTERLFGPAAKSDSARAPGPAGGRRFGQAGQALHAARAPARARPRGALST